MAILVEKFSYSVASLSSPAAIPIDWPASASTITAIDIHIGAVMDGGDATFNVTFNGVNMFSGVNRWIIPDGDSSFAKTGLSQAAVRGDRLRLVLEEISGGTVTAPIMVYVTFDDGAADFTAASTTEQLTGTATTKASTPDSVAALWEQGADVASAATVSLGEGGYFNITGTTAITDIDFATTKAGRKATVKFAGILTLTHHATNLILPTGASITTAAGDIAEFVSEGGDIVRCTNYQRADGTALAGGGGYTDEQAQDAVGAMIDASLTYVDATPLLQRSALTGDVTAAAGSNATTIANDAVTTAKILNSNVTTAKIADDNVTYAKMQNVSAASKLIGRGDSGSGDPQEITLGTGLSMSGTTLNATATGGGAGTFNIDDGTAVAGGTFTFDDGTAA